MGHSRFLDKGGRSRCELPLAPAMSGIGRGRSDEFGLLATTSGCVR
jgi:hypothetical protein